jgi:hypothetical protein
MRTDMMLIAKIDPPRAFTNLKTKYSRPAFGIIATQGINRIKVERSADIRVRHGVQ